MEFCAKGTITEDFFHHVGLGGLTIGTTNIIRFGNFGYWWAVFVIGTLLTNG